MDPRIRNYQSLLRDVPELRSVVSMLNKRHIRYGIYSGSYVYIATANRTPTDIDVLVADEDIPKIKEIFSGCQCLERDCCLYLYPCKNKKIEIVSRSIVKVHGKKHWFKLTDLAWRHTREICGCGCRVRLCDPVDTILIKAVLQRDESEGKHDLRDIEALIRNEKIDKTYLKERIKEFGFDKRLGSVLERYRLQPVLA